MPLNVVQEAYLSNSYMLDSYTAIRVKISDPLRKMQRYTGKNS